MFCEAFFIVTILVIVYMMYNIICSENGSNPLKWIREKIKKNKVCGCNLMPSFTSPNNINSKKINHHHKSQGFSAMIGKNLDEDSLPELAAMEGFADSASNIEHISTYDPVQMGAIKKSEVDSHYANLKDRSPFSAVGVTSARSVRRDDDPYMRDSGVPWVGGIPRRAYKSMNQGPRGGARETISASSASLERLGREARNSKSWEN
jgi:hypothetical protein